MISKTLQIFIVALFLLGMGPVVGPVHAAVPQMINHQGRVVADGVAHNGNGYFKFSLVNKDGSVTYWSNDGSGSEGSEPTAAVTLTVNNGLYAVLLGNTDLFNMSELPLAATDHEDVRLRVWFNDGIRGSQQIVPDQRLASLPYALHASSASGVALSGISSTPAYPMVAWGSNSNGQATVPALSGAVVGLAAGESHSLALLRDGTVKSWGSQTSTPASVTGIAQISSQGENNLGLKANGTVVGWNASGSTTGFESLSGVVQVAAGHSHGLALLSDGSVSAWGADDYNQRTVPSSLSAVVVKAIAAGDHHNLALTAAGTVVAWGHGYAGQISVPEGLTGVVAVAAGAYHSLALRSDGSVVAWGYNLAGQTTLPQDLSGVTQIAAGYGFNMALQTNGTLQVWGESSDGQTTIPASATDIVALAAGGEHLMVLRSDAVPAQLASLDRDNVFLGKVGIGRTPTTNSLEVSGNASKSAAGSWRSNSDRRIKTEVRTLKGALEKISQVRLVDFRYTDRYQALHPGVDDRRYLNVIAQEFAEVFPEHVGLSGEFLPDGSPVLQVDTYPLIIYSAAAIQELIRENATLKKQMAEQEQRLGQLEERLDNR